MTIYFKEYWKNDLEKKRLRIINLINEIFKKSNEKNYELITNVFNKINDNLDISKYKLQQDEITEEVVD